jgi:hypothetical protein
MTLPLDKSASALIFCHAISVPCVLTPSHQLICNFLSLLSIEETCCTYFVDGGINCFLTSDRKVLFHIHYTGYSKKQLYLNIKQQVLSSSLNVFDDSIVLILYLF